MDELTSEPTEFSKWQVQLLRDALDGYRMFTTDSQTGKPPISWNALRERIAVYTDIGFGKDDLRQFVEGKKKGEGNFRVPELKRLQAILRFLTDPSISVFSRDDFESVEVLDLNLPVHLSRFLRSAKTPELFSPPKSLLGQFRASSYSDDSIDYIVMNISEGSTGFFAISETVYFYDATLALRRKTGDIRIMSSDFRGVEKSVGWAVITPEDNVLFYMKEVDSQSNHYWKLIIEEPIWEDSPIQDFRLQGFDWPYEINASGRSDDEIKSLYFEAIAPRILTFNRANG